MVIILCLPPLRIDRLAALQPDGLLLLRLKSFVQMEYVS